MDTQRIAGLVLAVCLPFLAGSAGGRPKFVPAYLIQDAALGVAFWGPAGFLPNPDKAAAEGARSHWYGSSPDFEHWGFFTYHRTGPVTGLDPSYYGEQLERKWGSPAVAPRTLALPAGEALLYTFHRTEKGVEWIIHPVLVPAAGGAFDLTVFAPFTRRQHLAPFVAALAATLRVHRRPESRTYTLRAGVALGLDARWEPEPDAPDGLLFRAYRFNRRYRLDLAAVPDNVEPEAYLRAALPAGSDRAVALETAQVPAGRLWLVRPAQPEGGVLAVLDAEVSRLILDCVLPGDSATESLLSIARTITVTPGSETDARLEELARELRRAARAPGPALQQALDELTPFTGHPAARDALLPLLNDGREDAIIDAALQACEMAPFGPRPDELRAALKRASDRRYPRAVAALALALGRTGDPSVLDDLRPLLRHRETGVVCAAVAALGHVPFGKGEAAAALIDLYDGLSDSGRVSRTGSRGGAADIERNRALYFPILAALRLQSGLDFPLPDGPKAARTWLDERRRDGTR